MNIFKIILSISILTSSIISAANYYKVTSQIYLDIEHDGQPLERIIIGLFGEIAPNAVKNFRVICLDGIDGKTYVGSEFHRIIDRFMVQGGDIISGDGRGSISIYGKYFDDENMDKVNHTRGGFVAMANRGPNTNGCQFYITTMPAPWLNGKHTVFGIVIDGQSTVHFIEKVKTDTDDYPVNPVKIVDCGDVPIDEPFDISDSLFDVWGWIKAAIVPLGMSFCILGLFQWMIQKL